MKFFFHPTGMDVNGNMKLTPKDPGWIKVEVDGEKYDDALDVLPIEARDHIISCKIKREAEWNKEYDSVQDFLESTAGWGVGFTLMNEEDWKSFGSN